MEEKHTQNQCENSFCHNIVEEDEVLTMLHGKNKTLKQRYCPFCLREIEEERKRSKWRDEMGIG